MFLAKHKSGIYYLYYKNEYGLRRCVSTKTRKKSEAYEFLQEFKVKLKDKLEGKPEPIILRKLTFEFLKYSESVHSYNHTLSLKSTFKMLNNYFGDINASELTKEKILNYIQSRSRTVTPYTVKRDIESMSSLFNWAVDHKYMIQNFCKGIKRPRLPEKLPVYYTRDEFQKLINGTQSQDLKDIFIFAVNTGLRQMELLRLEWNQIDFSSSLLYLDNRNYLTKSKRIRTVPLNSSAIEVLKRRSENRHYNSIIFIYQGKVMNQQFISHKIKKIIKRTGLNPKLNFHSLRHTFASWLVQAGVSIYKVSKLLGHSSIRTTEIYAHLETNSLNKDVQKLV